MKAYALEIDLSVWPKGCTLSHDPFIESPRIALYKTLAEAKLGVEIILRDGFWASYIPNKKTEVGLRFIPAKYITSVAIALRDYGEDLT